MKRTLQHLKMYVYSFHLQNILNRYPSAHEPPRAPAETNIENEGDEADRAV